MGSAWQAAPGPADPPEGQAWVEGPGLFARRPLEKGLSFEREEKLTEGNFILPIVSHWSSHYNSTERGDSARNKFTSHPDCE